MRPNEGFGFVWTPDRMGWFGGEITCGAVQGSTVGGPEIHG